MTRVTRRHFLQFAGSTLAAIGLSQFDFLRQAEGHGRVLAQSTTRKLALLVGINNYSEGLNGLQGCLTDVEMQYELLVHRFGFNPSDVLTLTDNTPLKPNRANILEAFENHLINQAKPGDVVVFHFSGHGFRVIDPNPIPEFGNLNGTIVPKDAMPSGSTNSRIVVPDIMGRTLFLLMSLVNTDNLTVVLDSCHSGGGVRGNLVVRSADRRSANDRTFVASPEEFAYQQRLLSQLNWSMDEFQQRRRAGIAKGIAFGSAQADQLATDAPFDGFHAGAFTYLLTRYLWQQPSSQPTNSVFVSLARSTEDVAQSAGVVQEPVYQVQPNSNLDRQPVYFLDESTPAAEAVVRKVEGDRVEFWLGGISSQSLAAFREGAVFEVINAQGEPIGEIEQASRVGLVGYGKLRSQPSIPLQPGAFLREQVRGIPANLKLRIGLDPSLGDAIDPIQTALRAVDRIEVVPVDQQTTVDYLIGRMTESVTRQARQDRMTNIPPVGGIGLLTPGLSIVPESFGRADESLEGAIARLRPRFKMLLAGRILRMVLNSDTSDLQVTASVVPLGGRGTPTRFASRGAVESAVTPISLTVQPQALHAGTEIQVQITNNEPQNLYMGVVAIASTGDLVILHSTEWSSAETSALVEPGQTLTIPRRTGTPDEFQFILQGPSGFLEVLILASTQPLRDALRGLQRIARGRGTRSGDPLLLHEDEPIEVIESLLGDLDNKTRTGRVPSGTRGVDTSRLAAISAMIEVVE
jgi:hypothetical protein